ncbi:DUF882 domain-containing protein [Oryzifoliimicrobium ureilyticus]|uniref:DUF882 domain-containing protein n=1 Tax=Oryzifoliimicrobium ureilyticus TaxID=3113724 RepID=UPI003F676991
MSGMKAFAETAASLFNSLRQRVAQAALTLLCAAAVCLGSTELASAEERALKLFFTHTGEKATITFKRDGRFDPRGLTQINRFLRDWRKNEPARMDPRLLDLVWEVYRRSGGTDYIHIVSAYRSPSTNNMLRSRSRNTGVAKNSQHTLGKAMDFYIPGVKLSTLRAIAMQMQVGGVGFYPRSGSPFVHLDVGNVRAWPRMSRQELAQLFPNGRTLHLPAAGGPLPGYEQAVAASRKRGARSAIEIARVDDADEDDASATERPRLGLATALLPVPGNRNQALSEVNRQSIVKTMPTETKPDFAVPLPSMRPSGLTAVLEPDKALVTASIAPVTVKPEFNDLAKARSQWGATPRSATRSPLHKPEMIAFLPSARAVEVDGGVGDISDKALKSWALHKQGAAIGLRAPRFWRVHKNLIETPSSGTTGTAPASFKIERFG